MNIADLINVDCTLVCADIASKKRVLERLAGLIAAAHESLNEGEIFDKLIWRERLGSTGLGRGVALPHGKLPTIERAYGALIKLDRGVDFDTLVDDVPVDLVFALIVPEHFTDQHLKIIAHLAELFSNAELCALLRQAREGAELYEHLVAWSNHAAMAK